MFLLDNLLVQAASGSDNSYMVWVSSLIALLTAIFGAYTTWVNWKRSQELESQKKKNLNLIEYISRTQEYRYRYIDIVVIGPPNSGKSTLAKRWTDTLAERRSGDKSMQWDVREVTLKEQEPITEYDRDLDLQRTFLPAIRLRVWDYPGEPDNIRTAFQNIGKLDRKVTLVLLFNVELDSSGLTGHSENESYYNHLFINTVRTSVQNPGTKIARVFGVLNKIDILQSIGPSNAIIDQFRKQNKIAIQNIESEFGKLQFLLTSAETDQGVILLLREAGLSVLESPEEKQLFEAWTNEHAIKADAPTSRGVRTSQKL